MGTSNELENARGAAPGPGAGRPVFNFLKFEEPVSLTLQLGPLKCRSSTCQAEKLPKKLFFKNRRVDVFTAHVAAVLSTRIYSRSEEFRMVDV